MAIERIPITREGYEKLKANLDRMQNVEMIEVTGGKFWKPYGAKPDGSADSTSASPPSASDRPGSPSPAGR